MSNVHCIATGEKIEDTHLIAAEIEYVIVWKETLDQLAVQYPKSLPGMALVFDQGGGVPAVVLSSTNTDPRRTSDLLLSASKRLLHMDCKEDPNS
jgi:hypothetical protein